MMALYITLFVGLIWLYRKWRFSCLPEHEQEARKQAKEARYANYVEAIGTNQSRPTPYIRGVGQANDQINPAYFEWAIANSKPVPRKDDSYDGFLE